MANKTEAPESGSETLLHVFIRVQPLAAGESARQVVASGMQLTACSPDEPVAVDLEIVPVSARQLLWAERFQIRMRRCVANLQPAQAVPVDDFVGKHGNTGSQAVVIRKLQQAPLFHLVCRLPPAPHVHARVAHPVQAVLKVSEAIICAMRHVRSTSNKREGAAGGHCKTQDQQT
jgi:hypothetical protein